MKCIDDEIPFEIPEGWEWCRLGLLFSHCTGEALNGINKKGKLCTYITTSNLYWDRFEISSLKEMYFTDDELDKCTATKGDLLVCEGGDIGRSAIWNYDYDIRIQNHIHKLRAYLPLCTRFFYYVMFLYKGIGNIGGKGIGIQGLSSGALHNIILPLPSLREQERIVAQIETIIPLVVKYEKSQNELNRLNDDMYTRLRKSTLQEAIQGKLVPQDPNDEPASVLLERIREEKQRLLKEGKLKKKDITDSIIFKGDDNKYYEKIGKETICVDEEIPFSIPDSWEWVRMGVLAKLISGTSYQKGDVKPHGIRILRGGNIQNDKLVLFDDDVFLSEQYYDAEKCVQLGDTLIVASTGSPTVIGKPALIKETISRTQIGAFLRIVRPYHLNISSYLQLLFTTPYYREHIRLKAKGTNINNIKAEYIEQMIVPLPPQEEQERMLTQLNRLYQVIREGRE